MMIKRNPLKLSIVLSAAALVIGACGANTQSDDDITDAEASIPDASDVGDPENRDLTVQGASPAPNIGYLPMYVANSKGYFDEEGLDVKINYSHGDSAPLQAISTGKAEIMSGTPEELILGYEKGLRGVLFHQTYDHVIFRVAAPKDDTDIQTPADLEDTKIGVSSMASTGVLISKVLLKEAGGDPESLEFLPVGTGQQAYSALKSGKVDALALWDSPYAVLETQGAELNYWQPDAVKDVGDGGYFTSWDTIKDKPNALAHFSRAIAKAMKHIKDSPEDALNIYWEVNPDGKPKSSDKTAMEAGIEQLDVVGKSLDISEDPAEIDAKALHSYIDLFDSQGLIDEKPPVSSIMTNKFVPIAKKAVE